MEMVHIRRETLQLEEFLDVVSTHIRRKDIRVLLSDIGISNIDIDNVLDSAEGTWSNVECSWTGRVMSSRSYGINFLQQKRNAMEIWFETAMTIPQRKPTLWDQVSGHGTLFPSSSANSPKRNDHSPPTNTPLNMSYDDYVINDVTTPRDVHTTKQWKPLTPTSVHQQTVAQQTELSNYAPGMPDELALSGTDQTLEEILRKLWRGLLLCGQKRLVDLMQAKWVVGVDVERNYADVRLKTAPQIPTSRRPVRSRHSINVIGRQKILDSKIDEMGTHRMIGRGTRDDLISFFNHGTYVTSIDIQPVTSSSRHRTDTLRPKGAVLHIHVTVGEVILPYDVVTDHQMAFQLREKMAHIFFAAVIQQTASIYRVADKLEENRDVIVESVRKRNASRQSKGNNTVVPTTLLMSCKCGTYQALEQIWLIYQNGQLQKLLQEILVNKQTRKMCGVDNVGINVEILQDNYKKALYSFPQTPNISNARGNNNSDIQQAPQQRAREATRITHFMRLPSARRYKHLVTSSRITPVELKRKVGVNMNKILLRDLESIERNAENCAIQWKLFKCEELASLFTRADEIVMKRSKTTTQSADAVDLHSLKSLHEALQPKTPLRKTPRSRRASGGGALKLMDHQICPSFNNDIDLIRRHKNMEAQFITAYEHLVQMMEIMVECRSDIQERIVRRLNVNFSITSTTHLKMIKDLYLVLERWRKSENLPPADLPNDSQDPNSSHSSSQIDELFRRTFEISHKAIGKTRKILMTPAGKLTSSCVPMTSSSPRQIFHHAV